MVERKTNSSGYVLIRVLDNWVHEHRYVVEQFINRKLLDTEIVHHIDKNKKNNSISNLMIFHNQKAHAEFHIYFDKYGFNKRMRRLIAARWVGYKITAE